MATKKAVVTGGAGFIGSHLAEELVNSDYQVTVLDDLSNGRLSNIKSLLDKDTVKFIEGSVLDKKLLQRTIHDASYIFHLAALTNVSGNQENIGLLYDVNIDGTINVLEAARETGFSKVIFTSSAAIYGDSDVIPQHEEVNPKPISDYAMSKLVAEYYCNHFTKTYDLPIVCLRYFNVYGPRQDSRSRYSAVIPSFIKRISQGKPPVLYGDGNQTRDFVYVKDVVLATMLAAESDTNGILNIGIGQGVRIDELAKILIDVMEVGSIEPILEGNRPEDIKHSWSDISKARKIGYQPVNRLVAGLKETISSLANT